jgi:hypothetical protein
MDFGLQAIDELSVASGNEPNSSPAHGCDDRRQNGTGTERRQQNHPECARGKFPGWMVHHDWLSVAGRELPAHNEQGHEDNGRDQSTHNPHRTLSPFRPSRHPG